MNEFVWEFTSDKVRKLALRGFRIDRRALLDYRPASIETGVVYNADGSALVNLGGTKVVAGVKFELGAPYPDRPDEGALLVDAEILPHSSPSAEPGPPDEEAIELARVIDRSIRESNALDMKEFVIREGELVYLLFLDMRVLDDNGNLIDAASLASAAALLDAKVPRVEDDQIVRHEYERKLKLNEIPIYTTFVKIGKLIMVDPRIEEEHAFDARMSIATVDDGSIVAMQKGGAGSFSKGELSFMADEAIKKGREMRKLVKEAVGHGKD